MHRPCGVSKVTWSKVGREKVKQRNAVYVCMQRLRKSIITLLLINHITEPFIDEDGSSYSLPGRP